MSRLFPKYKYIKFQKWQACGNDFIITEAEPLSRETVIRLCDRHKGIGADGIIYVESSRNIEIADVNIIIANADGSRAEMCGNGIRCAGEYSRDQIGWWSHLRFKTAAGVKELRFLKRQKRIAVDMGAARLEWNRKLEVPTGAAKPPRTYEASYVDMGNPHCVLIVSEEETKQGAVERFGAKIEKMSDLFPNGTNVEFSVVESRERIRMRVWERGVGRTLACGTGACASAFAAYKKGLVENKVKVVLDGGEVEVIVHENDEIELIGPAEYVYSGELICIDEPIEDDDD